MADKKLQNEKTSFSQLLDGPVLLAKRASVVLLDPEAHAAVVKRMVALAPNDDTLLETKRPIFSQSWSGFEMFWQ